jgi:hypothetical protein
MMPHITVLKPLAQLEAASQVTLSSAGLAIMIVSLSAVVGLTVFCFYRVLTLPSGAVEGRLNAPLEIDTGDTQDAD